MSAIHLYTLPHTSNEIWTLGKREYQDKSYSNQFPNPKSSIKRIRATIIILPTTLSRRFSFFNRKYPKNTIANKIAKT